MKTQAFLARVLPVLASVLTSGVFNNAVAAMVPSMTSDLRSAAADDAIDVAPLENAIVVLGAATEFDAQQEALTSAIAQIEDLLEAIHKGEAPHATSPVNTAQDLVARILTTATSMRDVFTSQPDKARSIRADASELSAIVEGEVIARVRGEDAIQISAILFEGADRLAANDYGTREAAVETVISCAQKLAA